MDHVGPQPIVEEEVWEDVIPPPMVCSHFVLPLFADPVEGILGDLEILLSIFSSRNEEGNYLVCRQVMSPPGQQGMNPFVEMLDLPKEPTCGQLDCRLLNIFSEDRQLDDGMLGQRHRWSSVLSEMGQGELMGSIHCTRIPFILVAINQSHLSPLSKSYSANPLRSKDPHWYWYC